MKNRKLISLIIVVILAIYSCALKSVNNNKKSTIFIPNCEHCDSLIKFGFEYSYKEIDQDIDAIRDIVHKEYNDTILALTSAEYKHINDNLFCFLGMKNTAIYKYFPPNTEQVIWTKSENEKTLTYLFNAGDYYHTKNNRRYLVTEKDKNTEFWLIGFAQINLVLKKLDNEYIYSGTKQDSIRWLNCINQK